MAEKEKYEEEDYNELQIEQPPELEEYDDNEEVFEPNLQIDEPDPFADPDIDDHIDEDDELEVGNGLSEVASPPAKNILLFVLLSVASIVFLYFTIFKDDEAEVQKKQLEQAIKSQPVENATLATQEEEEPDINIGLADTPEIPDIENLQPPPPPEPEEGVSAFDDEFLDSEPSEELDLALPEEPKQPPQPAATVQKLDPSQVVPEPTPPPAVTIAPQQPEAPVVVVEESTTPQEQVVEVVEEEEDEGPTEEEIQARKQELRSQSMLVISGGGAPSTPTADSGQTVQVFNPASNELARTSFTQVTATTVGNTDFTITQGKIIDAILETAINTDLPGLLRAVTSRDVYGESGNNILIPRGSRLVGQYDNNIERGQSRVVVSWDRVIRPDGIDVALDSPGTDQLGRSGVTGIINRRILEAFTNALLVSSIAVTGAVISEAVSGTNTGTSTTTNNTDGSVSSSRTGTPTDFAVLEAIRDVSDVAENLTQNALNTRPTIYIDQGTRIKVFVNRDIIFPERAVSRIRFVD